MKRSKSWRNEVRCKFKDYFSILGPNIWWKVELNCVNYPVYGRQKTDTAMRKSDEKHDKIRSIHQPIAAQSWLYNRRWQRTLPNFSSLSFPINKKFSLALSSRRASGPRLRAERRGGAACHKTNTAAGLLLPVHHWANCRPPPSAIDSSSPPGAVRGAPAGRGRGEARSRRSHKSRIASVDLYWLRTGAGAGDFACSGGERREAEAAGGGGVGHDESPANQRLGRARFRRHFLRGAAGRPGVKRPLIRAAAAARAGAGAAADCQVSGGRRGPQRRRSVVF